MIGHGGIVRRPSLVISDKYRGALEQLDQMDFDYELFVAKQRNLDDPAHIMLRWKSGDTRLKVHGRGATLHEAFESVGAQVILWSIQAGSDNDI